MKNNKINRFLTRHITKLIGVKYYFPILALFWNNGIGSIIGFRKFVYCIHFKNKWKPGPLYKFYSIKIKKIKFEIDFSGVNLFITADKNYIAFLFFVIKFNKK